MKVCASRNNFSGIPLICITVIIQGQTFEFVGIDLTMDVFSHGQLYVVDERVTLSCTLASSFSDSFPGIGSPVVIVRLELLVVFDPLDAVAFDADECVDAVLLEQPLTKVERVERHSSRHGFVLLAEVDANGQGYAYGLSGVVATSECQAVLRELQTCESLLSSNYGIKYED
uniref:Uncharacterized protein n=1 Tax=Acrobeloides nanus TaxID=290746 RepID=A0A914E5G3_9BILA